MLIHFKNMRTSKNNLLIAICFTTLMLGSALQAMDLDENLDQQLLSTSRSGNIDQMRKLINRGANVNTTSHGWTPLLFAVENNHLKACEVLIENGADVNTANWNGITPLMFAKDDASDIYKLLLSKGANIFETLRKGGISTLSFEISKGYKNKSLFLIDTLLQMPINQVQSPAIALSPEQKGRVNALISSLKHTPIKGLSHDTKRLLIQDLINTFKKENLIDYIRKQIEETQTNNQTLKQELLNHLNSRIELKIQKSPQMMQKK